MDLGIGWVRSFGPRGMTEGRLTLRGEFANQSDSGVTTEYSAKPYLSHQQLRCVGSS